MCSIYTIARPFISFWLPSRNCKGGEFVVRMHREHHGHMHATCMSSNAHSGSVMTKIITDDQMWVCSYHQQNKQQFSQWKSPQFPKLDKASQVRSTTGACLFSLTFTCCAPGMVFDFYRHILINLHTVGCISGLKVET